MSKRIKICSPELLFMSNWKKSINNLLSFLKLKTGLRYFNQYESSINPSIMIKSNAILKATRKFERKTLKSLILKNERKFKKMRKTIT